MGLVTDPYFFRLDFIRKLAAQYARKACSIGYDRQVVSHAIGGAGFVQVLRRGKAVIADENLGYEYPLDVPFNCVIIGTDFICNSKTVSPQILGVAISRNLRIIDVKQGYTKCSLCPVRENAVITDDSGIEKVLLNNGYDVLKVSKGSVRLNGFDYGFIGGCSAMISRDILLFLGNFEIHSDKDRIKAFLQNYGITPQSLNGDDLTDIGSIIPLSEQQL